MSCAHTCPIPSPAQVCPLSDDTTYIKAFGSADAAVQNTNYSGKRGHGHCLLVGHLVDPLGRVIAVRPGGLLLLILKEVEARSLCGLHLWGSTSKVPDYLSLLRYLRFWQKSSDYLSNSGRNLHMSKYSKYEAYI